uniref:hypothetical protein n=1 Tax=Lactobacillus crispatus TaxID=47770 RepID=UPI0021BD43B7|nr:hypothetical protein [Lactobacillus crispatus]UVZ00386.1 hypothetical protein [Lactobacillus crispatus]
MNTLSKQNKKLVTASNKNHTKFLRSVIGLNILRFIISVLTCIAVIKATRLLLDYDSTPSQLKNTVTKVIWSMLSILLMFSIQTISEIIKKQLSKEHPYWNKLNLFWNTIIILIAGSIIMYYLISIGQSVNAIILAITILVLNSMMIS